MIESSKFCYARLNKRHNILSFHFVRYIIAINHIKSQSNTANIGATRQHILCWSPSFITVVTQVTCLLMMDDCCHWSNNSYWWGVLFCIVKSKSAIRIPKDFSIYFREIVSTNQLSKCMCVLPVKQHSMHEFCFSTCELFLISNKFGFTTETHGNVPIKCTLQCTMIVVPTNNTTKNTSVQNNVHTCAPQ